MLDGVGVVAQHVALVLVGAEEPVGLGHEVAQRQHAQPHGDGVVAVRPRDVDVGTLALQPVDQPLGAPLDLQQVERDVP